MGCLGVINHDYGILWVLLYGQHGLFSSHLPIQMLNAKELVAIIIAYIYIYYFIILYYIILYYITLHYIILYYFIYIYILYIYVDDYTNLSIHYILYKNMCV